MPEIVKEEIKQGETVTIPESMVKSERTLPHLERNMAISPYKDLIPIQEGIYHSKNVQPQVSKDAEKLLGAIFKHDTTRINEIASKYEKEYLTFQKRGQTRDRFISVDISKVRIFELATKAGFELQKKEIIAVKSELSTGSTAVVPETILNKEIVSDAENQHRVDLMNQKIKLKITMNVGVFHNGKLIKGGFKDAYSAHNFMNDSFFTGSRANKINFLNPADFGWKVELIDEKTEILNKDELKQIEQGETIEVQKAIIKAKDTRSDAQIIEDLSKEEKSTHRRPYSKLTDREKEIVDKATIEQYPVTSAHIGALVTILGTKEEALRSFDRLLRRGQTIEVPQRNLIRLIEPPRRQIAAPAPSGTHAISVYSAPVIQLLHKGEVIDLPESSFRKIIDKPKPGRITGSKKQKPSCIPPVKVRAYDRGCPIKRR